MSETLTDEQLREWRANLPAEFYPLFDDLLSIRAQSAELQMQRDHHDKFRQEAVAQRDALLVERIELEAALASGPTLSELAALRAERAKPTQEDEALAKEALRLIQWMEQGAHNAFANRPILAAFASIRAEGRAERAKLEADLEYRTSQRDNLYDRVAELDRALTTASAERAKLEAALRKEHHLASVRFDEPMLTRLDLSLDSLVQPAESGATVCVVCAEPLGERQTYIPTAKGPMHPYCW